MARGFNQPGDCCYLLKLAQHLPNVGLHLAREAHPSFQLSKAWRISSPPPPHPIPLSIKAVAHSPGGGQRILCYVHLGTFLACLQSYTQSGLEWRGLCVLPVNFTGWLLFRRSFVSFTSGLFSKESECLKFRSNFAKRFDCIFTSSFILTTIWLQFVTFCFCSILSIIIKL